MKKNFFGFCIVSLVFVSLVFLFQNAVPTTSTLTNNMCPTELGGNFNLGPETYRKFLIERSNIRWFRAIIDLKRLKDERESMIYNTTAARAKMKLRLDTIKQAKQDGLKVVISFKSQFKDYNEHIPAPDSDLEKKMFELVTFTIKELGSAVDIYVIGNEPIVETLPVDMLYNSTKGYVPVTRYYTRLADHIQKVLNKQNLRSNSKLYMGAFNRLDMPSKRDIIGIQQLLNYSIKTAFIDGIDLHVHVPSLEAFEKQMVYARNLLGNLNKGFIVTEYSLMWLFKKNLTSSLCFSNGQISKDFCNRLRNETVLGRQLLELRGTATELEFINTFIKAQAADKLPRELMHEFFTSRAYLPKNYMREAYNLFENYGVRLATYTFDQDNPNDPETWAWSREYDETDTPNRIYALFVPQMAKVDHVIPGNTYFYLPFKNIVVDANSYIDAHPECESF